MALAPTTKPVEESARPPLPRLVRPPTSWMVHWALAAWETERRAPAARTEAGERIMVVARRGVRGQQPAKNAVRKSKKSWELMTSSWLKSAPGAPAKKAVRKSKKSCELTRPSWLKSAGHGGGPPP